MGNKKTLTLLHKVQQKLSVGSSVQTFLCNFLKPVIDILGSAGHGAPVDWQLKAAQTVGDPKCSAWTETKLFSVGALEIQ